MYTLVTLQVAARAQVNRGGVGGYFKPSDLIKELKMSRSTAHRYIKSMLSHGDVIRTGFGKYQVAITPETIAIALCVLSPVDVYAFHSGYTYDEFLQKFVVTS